MSLDSIKMIDLAAVHARLADEIEPALLRVARSGRYIGGSVVEEFSSALGSYLGTPHIVPCGNGTDALMLALMTLGLRRGDAVVMPAFTYAATIEAALILGLEPILVDVDPFLFTLSPQALQEGLLTQIKQNKPLPKAAIAVHLYGQAAPIEELQNILSPHAIPLIEDNAQALGCRYTFSNGTSGLTGSLGEIGCHSFFPTKNLGCYGDGGALSLRSSEPANLARQLANHGQPQKYVHTHVGCNSRLDALQAAVLQVKLRHLEDFLSRRRSAASLYDQALGSLKEITCPQRATYSSHTFHQYTIQVPPEAREELRSFLQAHHIDSMVYYPQPLQWQPAYRHVQRWGDLGESDRLAQSVLSLPIHTEITPEQQLYTAEVLTDFFQG